MKLKFTLTILGVFLAVFLVACAKAPSAAQSPEQAPGAAVGAGQAGDAMAEKPVASEAKFKITKQTALRNPSRVVFAIQNIGEVDSSIELTVSLVYARQAVATKTETASLNVGESKELTVEFPETANFNSYTIEGAGLENPVKPAGS